MTHLAECLLSMQVAFPKLHKLLGVQAVIPALGRRKPEDQKFRVIMAK